MRRIVIKCPNCGIQKNETVLNDLVELRKSINKGLVLIRISESQVCEHSFFIEIDKNFSIRNTYSLDDAKKFPKELYPHYLSLKTY